MKKLSKVRAKYVGKLDENMLTEGVKLFVPILTTLGYDGDDKLPIKPMSFDSMRTTIQDPMSSHRGHLTRFVRVIGGWGVKILLYERKGRQVMFDDCMYVVTHKNELGDDSSDDHTSPAKGSPSVKAVG